MQIYRDINSVRNFIQQQKEAGKKVGLVPTMGALHAGHLSLVRKSLADTDVSIVSIFVNPIQFNNPSDLEKYPNTFDQDIELLQAAGCQNVFCPPAKTMYPTTPLITLDFKNLDKILEGKYRPGHFSGVGIVVSKLFNIIQPNVAYFGQKDYQQFLIIRQLVQDFNVPVELVCGEIIREPGGLAMSSRNQRLSPDERKTAGAIFRSLSTAKEKLGEKNMIEIRNEVELILSKSGLRLEYLELADRSNLNILQQIEPAVPSILLMAAYLGEVRLIDNMFV